MGNDPRPGIGERAGQHVLVRLGQGILRGDMAPARRLVEKAAEVAVRARLRGVIDALRDDGHMGAGARPPVERIPADEGDGMSGATVTEPPKAKAKGVAAPAGCRVVSGHGSTRRTGPREPFVRPGATGRAREEHTRDGAES
ncbi:hypothetical protein [Streptomyces sp. B1I3]|uniref:hypothetical protein n=1 Tax=Streptomyces sp. B1I3 TaxID=3042264 RepID=UPI0027888122|nr:hypothetical protein [Streptomyces sp. B1I3]MDQ0792606.1 hypothetical protein [Streptomyces sp. B1I3]